MDNELRFYCFVNFYLSSIQQGIQTGHASVDLVTKYLVRGAVSPESTMMVTDWAFKWKTYIILNGGDADGIRAISEVIKASDFPWIEFSEAKGSLDGIQTCVGVVLPETVFNAKQVAPNPDMIAYEYVREHEACTDCGRTTPQAIEACDRWGCKASSTRKVISYPASHKYVSLISTLKGCRLAQ